MILKNVRNTWMYVFQTKKNPFGGEEKYEATVIIKKDNQAALDEFNKSIQETIDKVKDEHGPKAVLGVKFELKDGDSATDNPKGYDFLKGCYFFTCKNKKVPELYKAVKQDGKIVKIEATKEDYYNGMNAAVICNPYVYNANNKKGITLYLNGIIKLNGGEKIGGSNSVQDIDIEDVFLAEEDDKNSDWDVL